MIPPRVPHHFAFPYDHFLEYFPELAPEKITTNTPEFIVGCGRRAAMYLSNYDNVWLNGDRRIYAHCLLAAHIIYLTNKTQDDIGEGGNGKMGDVPVGPVTSTGVGGVSISMQTPGSSNDGPFEWWLNKSPYGQEFLALIRTRGPSIAFIGSKTPVLPLR